MFRELAIITMHYFIDGYNLIFRIFHANDDLQAQREQLIIELNEKIQYLGLDVTLVFDSHSREGKSSRSHVNTLEICYTAEGETADAYIISQLKRSKGPETVVTADKSLAANARDCAAKTETPEHFLSWVDKSYSNKCARQQKQTNPSVSQKIPDKEMERWLRLFNERWKRQR